MTVYTKPPGPDADKQAVQPPAAQAPQAAEVILIHFLEDGFTAFGQVWYRGQELEIRKPSKHYDLTCDRTGASWLELATPAGEMDQARRYGKIMFRLGPWPGDVYDEAEAAKQEQQRKRQPPPVASVLGRAR